MIARRSACGAVCAALACRAAWACALAIRVTAQRPQWPLQSVGPLASTACAAWWPLARPPGNAPWGDAWSRVSGASRGCRAPVPCGRRERPGASRRRRCLSCSTSQAGHGRSRHGAGTGQVAGAAALWSLRTGAKTWPRSACWSCTPARWPPRPLEPRPPPTPRQPHVSQSTSSVSQCAGVRGSPMPQRPWRSTPGVGRDGVDARRGRGVTLACATRSKRSVCRQRGRGEVVRRRRRARRSRSASASGFTQRPWGPLRTRTGGPSSRPR
jgi:hypothetical protein